MEEGAEAFAAACAADIAGFADLVLYLRYSSFDSSRQGGSWREELSLAPDQRRFLEEAFAGANAPGTALSTRDARARFLDAFASRCFT